ncbi:MAG: cytochrome ubiquinol oxidase subunit I [Actinomycetia bacterium]|nr:cytochrome ubiquinol oxidase subunit I [Actinomycetes bacterium]
MTELGLARLQFGVTTVYHFLFVPLTIGLSFLLAILETVYVKTQDPAYKKLVDFFGRLFLINFAVGVVTGILQEFQFGMNWSNYSRFVGDVFGAPLAVEALLAFFLESTFLGVWIFGWDRLSPRAHAWSMWLVAIGTSISAFWILVANSFMQEPVGYALRSGHAEMVNFFALLGNPQLWVEFPHVWLGSLATGAFFMTGVSAYYLVRGRHPELFDKTFRLGAVAALVASVLVFVVGHDQAQHLVTAQPMKIAASEALWHTSPERAPWTLVANIDTAHQRTTDAVQIPDLLSILAYNHTTGRVTGIDELQAQYVKRYGPGDYVPPVVPTFWSFRLMILAGTLMILAAAWAVWLIVEERHQRRPRFLKAMVWAIGLPYLAEIMGWIMTEVGRQPWVVFGLETTANGVSPTVSATEVWITLVGFGLLYGAMAVADVYLLLKYIRLGPDVGEPDEPRLEADLI